jgi:biopolymer transport protein ExbD/biopolymer transport protein TolR
MGVALHKHDDEFDDQPVSEINVTPLVDVMLVLLIVFMVAAPLMTSGVPVDLPKTQAKPLNDQKPPLAVSLDAAGKYFIGSNEVPPDQLLSTLLNQAEAGLDQRIHVRADKDLPYRAVLEVMGQIIAAGFTKVALVSDPPQGAKAPSSAAAAGASQAAGPAAAPIVEAPGSTTQPATAPVAATPPVTTPVAAAPAEVPQGAPPVGAPPTNSSAAPAATNTQPAAGN